MGAKVLLLVTYIVLLGAADGSKKLPKPCKNLAFHFHDILYDGSNRHNATSAKVGGAAAAANFSNNFGDMVVFDDPLTVGKNMQSAQVGRGQGLYFYDSTYVFSAWFSLTVVLNSTEHKGTLTMAGADYPIADNYRYFSVVGGTGDFFMARGTATISTEFVDLAANYFRLFFNITLYDCFLTR